MKARLASISRRSSRFSSGVNSTLAMLLLRQLPLDLAQLFDIHHVLGPASSDFQAYQVVDARHRNRERPDTLGDRIALEFVERNHRTHQHVDDLSLIHISEPTR